jgi:hypothetical protein
MSQYGMQRSQPLALTLMTATGDSDIVAAPRPVAGVANTLTWTSKPNSLTALNATLYGSLDGVVWVSVDSTTSTANYGKCIPQTAFLFDKVTVATLTGTFVQFTFHVA